MSKDFNIWQFSDSCLFVYSFLLFVVISRNKKVYLVRLDLGVGTAIICCIHNYVGESKMSVWVSEGWAREVISGTEWTNNPDRIRMMDRMEGFLLIHVIKPRQQTERGRDKDIKGIMNECKLLAAQKQAAFPPTPTPIPAKIGFVQKENCSKTSKSRYQPENAWEPHIAGTICHVYF